MHINQNNLNITLAEILSEQKMATAKQVAVMVVGAAQHSIGFRFFHCKVHQMEALEDHISVEDLNDLVTQYTAPSVDSVMDEVLYYDCYWLWALGLMPSVVSELRPNDREYCDFWNVVYRGGGYFNFINSWKLFCCRPSCMRFGACYCGNQLPLRHVEEFMTPESVKHRLDKS